MWTLSNFYSCPEWIAFRNIVINARLNKEGLTICEHCGKPIVRAYDIILHHVEELTQENVNDVRVSLNADNIKIVHHACHNKIHDRLGLNRDKQVFLVYGPPLSGKTSYVNDVKNDGDLIIDMDSIWQMISGCDRYVKPSRLKSVAFGIRDKLIEDVRYRRGNWLNAYVIGGYPLISERQRLIKSLGAREIFIECSEEECIKRLSECEDKRKEDMQNWITFIEDWFDKYGPPILNKK